MQRNPFHPGDLALAEMIDREAELARLNALIEGGDWCRLAAPRRYGKTMLLRRALQDASARGDAAGPSGRGPSAAEPDSPEAGSRPASSAAAGRAGGPSPSEGGPGGPGLLALLRAMKRLSRIREADGTAAERTEPSRPSIFVEPLQAPPGARPVRVALPRGWRARSARDMAAPRQR